MLISRRAMFMLFSVLSVLQLSAQIQELSAPFNRQPISADWNVVESTDTLFPPFVDDFSYPSSQPSPALWQDQYVWVNDNMPLFQNSIGVATFDGLNEFGFAYKEGAFSSDTFADVLTSRYLDLQGLSDVYLSFEYQETGRGEAPSNGDSLVVEFWSPLTQTWTQQWGTVGTGQAAPFKSVILPVQGLDYLQRGFQFRFGSYGARAGAYDIWNVDYVQLDKDRTASDTIITEPALARKHPLIIGTGAFTSWPWWVSTASNVSNRPSTLAFTYRRNGLVPSGGWSLNMGQFRWEENSSLISQITAVPVITNTQHDVDQTFSIQVPPNALTNLSGPTTVETKVWFDGSAAGFRSNDTVRGRLELDNYLSLDDGSAERAYAVQNITGGRVAQLFRTSGLGPADSLKGVRFNFVDAGTRYSSTFRLAVWAPADSGNIPGSLIYLTDSLYEPNWGYDRGDMIPYDLDSAVDLSSYPFVWIGYVCTSADPLYIGLDTERTLPASMPRTYGDGFNWYPSLEPGVALMQPYFRYSPGNMVVLEQLESVQWSIYPNPSPGALTISSPGFDQGRVRIYSLQGSLIFNETCQLNQPMALEWLPTGMYIVELQVENETFRKKWLKH